MVTAINTCLAAPQGIGSCRSLVAFHPRSLIFVYSNIVDTHAYVNSDD